ncbi:MAG TPA: DUF1549 domain-containing protein [Chthonomonadaceae bacterium]|nr:DUF1549 domain-containing protein [Chthonomonadaceae bacterium]
MRFWKIALLLPLITLVAAPALAQKRHSTPTKSTGKSAPASAPDPIPARVEFLRDVAPILDRGGCSSAGCHGKFGGRGGFQVSLLTLNPEDDYEPLIYGARGRRVNFAAPEKSLLLLKATNTLPHVGGKRFEVGSTQYKILLKWIQAGAPFDDKDPRPASVTIQPNQITLQKVGEKRQLKVIATYTDGSTRDVTKQTSFQTTNDVVLAVTQDGMVTGSRWGGGAVLARYLGIIASSAITLPQDRKGPYPATPTNNTIDKYVFDNLKRLNVLPSKLSDDSEFLRRVTLDTLGRLPTLDETDAFLGNSAPDKRTKLIDELLERPEFADYRTLRLCDLLRVNPRKLGGNGNLADRSAALFYEWIWDSVDQNKPWDQFVREILMARGSAYQNGPSNFYRVERSANDRMENLGQAFLGVRMSCARCHKHPFDRWTTDDYWNFASFMGKVGINGGRIVDENVIFYNHGAQTVNQSVNGHNRGKVAPATFLGEKTPAPDSPDMIASLADWVTNSKNPFFARATVNRLWSYYFGRGIVHPVDDMRSTTPESVPGLLDALAKEFVDHKYDTKYIIRLILNSRAYQLTAIPNDSNSRDDRFFSHFFPKPMPAQALLDMLNQATGVQESFGSFPERNKAVQAALPPQNYFLSAFGQSHREFLADIDPKLEPNLVQTLIMINSPYVDNKVRSGNTIKAVMDKAQTDEDVVKALYMRTFCRQPSATELSKATALIQQAKDRREGAQDLLWALVTAREFFFNH